MTTQERLLKFEAENNDLSLRTSHLDCQIAIRRLLDDLAAAREDVARISVLPRKRRVPLDSCPVGLFLFRDTLAVMTEYATVASGNVRQRDAYIVASGEYFWGGTSDPRERAKLLVLPCHAAIDSARAGGGR